MGMAGTLCALFFPPVEKRPSLPPRLTPLSTNNFVRCTLQNRIIKSLFSKVRRKNKNNQKNTSFKLHMKNKNNNKLMFVYDILPSPTTFLLYRSLQHCLIVIRQKQPTKRCEKKNNEKICDILNLLDE